MYVQKLAITRVPASRHNIIASGHFRTLIKTNNAVSTPQVSTTPHVSTTQHVSTTPHVPIPEERGLLLKSSPFPLRYNEPAEKKWLLY